MVLSRDESLPSRIELVVLACLSQSKPPSDAELGDTLQLLALPRESATVARQRALEALARLVQRAWANGDDVPAPRGKQRKAPPPRTLTDGGKRVLREAFHLSRLPTWAQVRDKHLPALGLGLPTGADLAGISLTEDALTAAVLGARFGVRDAPTPMSVCDALIADALGMPAGKLTLERIRAHMLLRGIDRQAPGSPAAGSKGYTAKLASWIACTTVGVSAGSSGTPRRMARALARRWVCGEALPLGAGSTTATPGASPQAAGGSTTATPGASPQAAGGPAPSPSAPTQPTVLVYPTQPAPTKVLEVVRDAPNLLEVVRESIRRIGAEGRFGEKVYVSAIWRSIERDRAAGELSLDRFKHWLVSANRNGWLVLARADLIGAMDAKQINDSEINDRGATFHFVLDQRSAAASQRESHAG